MDGWKNWINKKVFIKTKRGRFYTGIVLNIDYEYDKPRFLELNDKFDKTVMFSLDEIAVIEEEN